MATKQERNHLAILSPTCWWWVLFLWHTPDAMLWVYVFSYQDGWPPHSWAVVPRRLEAEHDGSELLELLTSWSPISSFSLPLTTETCRAYQQGIQLIPLRWWNSIHEVNVLFFSSCEFAHQPYGEEEMIPTWQDNRFQSTGGHQDRSPHLSLFEKMVFWKGMPEEVTTERSWHFVHLNFVTSWASRCQTGRKTPTWPTWVLQGLTHVCFEDEKPYGGTEYDHDQL